MLILFHDTKNTQEGRHGKKLKDISSLRTCWLFLCDQMQVAAVAPAIMSAREDAER